LVAHSMASIGKFLKRFLPGAGAEGELSPDPEALRAAFKDRYHHFKLLLNANNKALEIMSEMEETLRGNRPFGMSFVRAHATAISVNVFRIIKNLDELAPKQYLELYSRFREIQDRINQELTQRDLPLADRLVYPLEEVDKTMADQVGCKMANLGEIKNRVGLAVPDGFVVSSLSYQRFMAHSELQAEIDRLLQSSQTEKMEDLYGLSSGIQQLIIRSGFPPALESAIREAYEGLEREAGAGVTVSLRSSALAEDASGTSFAGQYRSILNVGKETILEAYKEIIASKYSVPAMAYRLNRGIRDEDIAMCVGCMVMVPAVSSGVMYSRNPLQIRDPSVHINAVWGLPKSVVDGSVTPDCFVVARDPSPSISRRDIRIKEREFVCDPREGVCRLEIIGERKSAPSLTDERVLQLAEIAVRLETHYGAPQDIEWAISREGRVHLLQCRPLQQQQSDRTDAGREEMGAVREGLLLAGGSTASPGVGCGRVFRVDKEADMLRFPEGAVLVASQSLPRWAALLSRAAGVVTEQGSVTGHLANVAREFGVPALFGISDATRLLQENELVTVDADGLRVYRGRVEDLLAEGPPPRNLMAGSPVHDTLRIVMAQVAPLHLIDPDSPLFRPGKCETFHDITRFAHEKSIQEMFRFGKTHRFPERSSKQLVCDVPMQWWILNLDDGFHEEVQGKHVRLENIASIPMLAIWDGIVAVPWEGPPSVDRKGFMSVMVQATVDPGLDPSMRSPYANRNYFMISRNYCSLNSRLGFHFSGIEALVSERAAENYVSFHFKGGAADYPRRVTRAAFVADILMRFGFRAEVKEDATFARLEGREEGFMRERLRLLGYLTIHTRQLDMVMANSGSFHQYREKILHDLEQVVLCQSPSSVSRNLLH
jgi:pyruvate,water dikinase